jgi:hypothetical protein
VSLLPIFCARINPMGTGVWVVLELDSGGTAQRPPHFRGGSLRGGSGIKVPIRDGGSIPRLVEKWAVA